jgi:hypothetical protein
MKLHVPVEQGKNFADAFLGFAKSNNLKGVELDGNPAPGEMRESEMLQINSKQGYPLFILNNTMYHDEFELSAYPSDIPLTKQHIYNLVQTMLSGVHGKIEFNSCDEKILDCDRLEGILQKKVTKKQKPVVIETTPILELIVSVEQGKILADTILTFATSNNLTSESLNRSNGKREISTYQIYNKQKSVLYIFHNYLNQNEFELAAYPDDTPLVKQYIYKLVQTLSSTFHGHMKLKSCDEKMLDCVRLKGLLHLK